MARNSKQVVKTVLKMEDYLKKKLESNPKKQWDEFYIKKQIDSRNGGASFDLKDHIRAMIYAMLSAGSVWDRFEKFYNPETGHYDTIDKVFCCYNAEKLIEADKIALQTALQHEEIKGGNRSIKVQLKALPANIRKMQKWQKKCGCVDAYLQQFIDEKDGKPDFKRLVRRLADEKSEDKLQQMGEALCAEYLRNVGYDLAKPDAHVCKALGNGEDGIGSVDKIEANPYEVLDIVKEIADAMGKTPAEVDYILWAFYAKGYGDGGKNGCRA